ncbi:acyl carrier protein [Streptacidiphilus sp. PB12-B1b]|uniref:acyl carrier protein n=1 Tax=Streptacidiphilus sp. PB12-B1b TaxID=2705012 RepID=UPI0015FB017A|nr:acyl carrier protein [Streptacidiphilus sp. PB12-B1b]QMU78142.1 acyl carrier protein [Streptacidiphilus sp. PB12-B1b]
MPGFTEHQFHDWLIERVSRYVRRPQEEINVSAPFAEYGMDSVAALSLFGDIEEAFGMYLEPTVAWDHPTVEALARFLARESAEGVVR